MLSYDRRELVDLRGRRLDRRHDLVGRDGQMLCYVRGGRFMMGSQDGYENEEPVHRVALDSLWIGQCEVADAHCRASRNATGRTSPARSWRGDDYPVLSVSWHDAVAYCRYCGCTLPTEDQWEYAARGPAVPRYPWGDEWDAQKCCNYYNVGAGNSWTYPVRSSPEGASWCGALDMAGNVWEWCADWYSGDYYAVSPGLNPPGPASGCERVIRGGSWFNGYSTILRAANRSAYEQTNMYLDCGFRVCYSIIDTWWYPWLAKASASGGDAS